MWLFTKHGFYSVVEKGEPGTVLVRAREPGALDALRQYMPDLGPQKVTPHGDYRYRASIAKGAFADGLAAVGRDIDYPNFKSKVDAGVGSRRFAAALHKVWDVMERIQPGGAYGAARSYGGYPAVPQEEKGGSTKRVQSTITKERHA